MGETRKAKELIVLLSLGTTPTQCGVERLKCFRSWNPADFATNRNQKSHREIGKQLYIFNLSETNSKQFSILPACMGLDEENQSNLF